jgi:hypothetical protein
MPNNRAGSRVGRWGAALLVALALTGVSHQAGAAAAQQTPTAVAQQTATPAAKQTPSATAQPTASATAQPTATAAAKQTPGATASQPASATAPQSANAVAQQAVTSTVAQQAATSAVAQQAATSTVTSTVAAGDDFPVLLDPTQPSTLTVEVISPDSRPAQAPGIAELVAALPPFTIQHFPPDVLLNAPNPANGRDAVEVAKACAPDVPKTPPLVPLPRNKFEKAQDTVETAKEQFACLVAIEQEEAKETDTIQVDSQSNVQDRIGIPEDVPVAVNPTIGAPEEEDIHAPKEVKAAAEAAQEANKPGEPGELAEPVFTRLVPDGVGCKEVQDEVLQVRAGKVSVEAELEVIKLIVEQCS